MITSSSSLKSQSPSIHSLSKLAGSSSSIANRFSRVKNWFASRREISIAEALISRKTFIFRFLKCEWALVKWSVLTEANCFCRQSSKEVNFYNEFTHSATFRLVKFISATKMTMVLKWFEAGLFKASDFLFSIYRCDDQRAFTICFCTMGLSC